LAVVVPIKSFTSAKARLADVLSPTARATLARACAETVLRAAQPLPVFVVCDDHDVATWAANRSATVVRPDHAGLNAAATVGRAAAALAGFERVLLIHSDLPRAESLATLDDDSHQMTIVPDRHDDGTNALVLPATGHFDFHYGVGSFIAHRAEAAARGMTVRIVRRNDLALDLDTLDDLHAAGLMDTITAKNVPQQ